MRFCFNAPERAEAFQARFGGSPQRIEIRPGAMLKPTNDERLRCLEER
jgi:hypothetical protein